MQNVNYTLDNQRKYFDEGNTKEIDFRLEQLKKLKLNIKKNENKLIRALKKDLCKSVFESYTTEIGIVYEEINIAIKNLKKWAKPTKVKTPITNFSAHSYIYSEPFGVVLIISPWNYPIQLLLAPLVGAIAAGNCAVLKPSEIAKETECVLTDMIRDTFDESYISIVNGGAEVSLELLKEKFDYIFFTGGEKVGKIVMKSAAEHLTPVTLELGGKSPCIVDEDADVELSAKRIVWGKFLNAGQTCVAPDYVLAHKKIKERLLDDIKEYISIFFGDNPKKSPDYGRIINEKNFWRLREYIRDGRTFVGGDIDKEELYIAPTVLDNLGWGDLIMKEEVFGPILPVMEYDNLNDAIKLLKKKSKPLAMYLFMKDKKKQQLVINSLSFGGGCINDTVMHLVNPYLPFGGVGSSGVGSYHGKNSFDTFSHKKSILKKSYVIDVEMRYPPYEDKINLARRLMK